MVYTIRKIGDPILRLVAEPVGIEEIATPKFQQLIDDLVETMRNANGAGIAAPQVGISKRIFIAEVNQNPRYPHKPQLPLTVVINPEIKFLSTESYDNFEGCLSVPGLRGMVKRCPLVKVTGMAKNGSEFSQIFKGITAGTFQHENDHLNGELFIDKVKDTTTLCTIEEYEKHHSEIFGKMAELTIEKFGG